MPRERMPRNPRALAARGDETHVLILGAERRDFLVGPNEIAWMLTALRKARRLKYAEDANIKKFNKTTSIVMRTRP